MDHSPLPVLTRANRFALAVGEPRRENVIPGVRVVCLAAVWMCLGNFAIGDEGPAADQLKFFESKVRPLLIEHCQDCHGAETQESRLRLDKYSGMRAGGVSGPAVVPGNPEESLLIAAVNYQDEHLQMPPDGKLPAEKIAILQQWIEMGAPHPEQNETASAAPRAGPIDLDEAKKFWAFQPVQRPVVSGVGGSPEDGNEIDQLILARMREQQLRPNPPAEKRQLIRRATFDLIGLPPTPEEIAAFLADESPGAFETVVDRLLASPLYGQRWGRHWLDVVRYADSNGQDENQGFVDAWRYRNYVIDAFNADKPFDQFLVEQIAGDLLPANATAQDGRAGGDQYAPLVATGFLLLGPKVLAEKDEAKLEMDIIDEQIDVLSQAVMGLTLACARCHDHKFDPLFTADYYALAGIFKSTKAMQSLKTIAKYNERTLASAAEVTQQGELQQRQAELQKELDALTKPAAPASNAAAATAEAAPVAEPPASAEAQAQVALLREQLEQVKQQVHSLPTAMSAAEGTPMNTRIHVRGSHLTLGMTVPRGFPAVLKNGEAPPIPENSSGRWELAQWLTNRDHPLTARVMVNRIWRWHFGRGLVATTDNFGKLGSAPSHPELLDWLAAEFMENGWSIKSLHRRIMLSQTYQSSSAQQNHNAAIDPENIFLWRAPVQRLDAESIRDSLLAVSGQLDCEPAEAVLSVPKWELVFDHTSKDATTYSGSRRSVYLPVIRNNLYDPFALFDYTSPDVTTGSRESSTVAPQALFAMNGELFLQAAAALAVRLQLALPGDDGQRVAEIYELALGRPPESHEVARLLHELPQLETQFLQAGESESQAKLSAWTVLCQAILASNEFLYIN